MLRPSSSALLLSALLNTGDVTAAQSLGITPEQMGGYQNEYRWLLSYYQMYKEQPSWAVFQDKFPDFPRTEHTELTYCAEEVRYAASKQLILKAVRDAGVHIREGDLEQAYTCLATIHLPTAPAPLTDVLSEDSFLDDYGQPVEMIPSTMRTLTNVTGGFRRGDLLVYAARTSVGKSWCLANQAVESAMQGLKVVYFSLEMSEEQIRSRMHSIAGARLGMDVKHSDLHGRTYDIQLYKELLYEIRQKISGSIHITDFSQGRVSPHQVQAMAGNADLIIIDYIGLMSSSAGSRAVEDWRIAATISNQLKEVAIAANARILAASQINREGDSMGWRPPKVRHLAQSDAFGQDADLVLTMKKYGKRAMVYSVEKNRHGPSDILMWSRFEPNLARFAEITRDVADELRDEDDD
jgi:hypothetical protein